MSNLAMSSTEATTAALRTYKTTGAPVTPGVQVALANRAKVTDVVTQLQADRETFGADFYAAIIDGSNLDSAKLATAARRRSWAQDTGLLNALNMMADNAITQAMKADAPAMIDHLRELFEPVAAQLTAEFELLGDIDLDADGRDVLNRGEKQAAALVRARAAVSTIRSLHAAFRAVVGVARWALPGGSLGGVGVLAWTPATFLDMHRDTRSKRANEPYAALTLGHELHMMSAAEFRQFARDVEKEQARRLAQAREDAHRQPVYKR